MFVHVKVGGIAFDVCASYDKMKDAFWRVKKMAAGKGCIGLSEIKRNGYWDAAALSACGTAGRQEAKRIGSELYRKMFLASSYSARAKARLPIWQMGGIIDEYGMLQLTRLEFKTDSDSGRITGMQAKDRGYCFDEGMEPGSLFLGEYARTVAEAYGETGLDCPFVHQFRMYIDLHNISFIRTRYPGDTDLEKLLAYEKETGEPLDYGSSSRLHNRKLRKELGERKRQVNDKIKSRNGLSEFIVRMRTDEYGQAGQFVTQWDYLKVDQKTGRIVSDPKAYTIREYKSIVETESFNYCKNDRVMVAGMDKLHTRLDVDPANGRTGYENELKREGKKYWVADKAYREEFAGKRGLRMEFFSGKRF